MRVECAAWEQSPDRRVAGRVSPYGGNGYVGSAAGLAARAAAAALGSWSGALPE
jgi:hypothetical protein